MFINCSLRQVPEGEVDIKDGGLRNLRELFSSRWREVYKKIPSVGDHIIQLELQDTQLVRSSLVSSKKVAG